MGPYRYYAKSAGVVHAVAKREADEPLKGPNPDADAEAWGYYHILWFILRISICLPLWLLLGKISLFDLNIDLDFCHSIQVLHTQLPSDDVFKIVSKNF